MGVYLYIIINKPVFLGETEEVYSEISNVASCWNKHITTSLRCPEKEIQLFFCVVFLHFLA